MILKNRVRIRILYFNSLLNKEKKEKKILKNLKKIYYKNYFKF